MGKKKESDQTILNGEELRLQTNVSKLSQQSLEKPSMSVQVQNQGAQTQSTISWNLRAFFYNFSIYNLII